MLPTLGLADLKRGDVLLFHGNGLLSRFIRLFDGSIYSHAGIFDGEHIVEAEAVSDEHAIEANDPLRSCRSASFTHVFRFVNRNKLKLGDATLPYDPVGKVVDAFKNSRERYAYSQIMLLGVLIGTRKLPIVPGLAEMLRHVLDESAEWLNLRLSGGQEVIICSELVYKCFDDLNDVQYQVEIAGVDPAAVSTGLQPRMTLMPETTEASSDSHFGKQVGAFMSTYALARGLDLKNLADEANKLLPLAVPAFVTPRDLATSPNLVLVGQLVISG